MAEKTIIDVIVTPRSSKTGITVDENDLVRVRISSPPVDGKANEECVSLIAKKLHIAKSRISIQHGASGRKKQLAIQDITLEEIRDLLR